MTTTLAPALAAPAPSTRTRWAGRILTGVPVLFLIFDAAIKIVLVPEVSESMIRLGWPDLLAPGIGLLELACLLLYLFPRTAPLGAVLLTGYLGGAVASHLRIGDPLATHTLFPIYVGTLLWAGLYLRDARIRALLAPNR